MKGGVVVGVKGSIIIAVNLTILISSKFALTNHNV